MLLWVTLTTLERRCHWEDFVEPSDTEVLHCCVQVLFDLLSSSPGTPDDLTIIDEGGATVVKGLTQLQVQSEAEALALLFEGKPA